MGKCGRPAINMIGHKVNRLTVIAEDGCYIKPHSGKKDYKWLCRCECGSIKSIRGNTLRRGNIISCGCRQKEIAGETAGKRRKSNQALYSHYVHFETYERAALKRNLKWNISLEQFIDITSKNCTYCNLSPQEYLRAKNMYIRTSKRDGRPIDQDFANSRVVLANGIDRKDSNIGYFIENCVPCCSQCNIAKGDTPYSDWIAWIERLVSNARNIPKSI